jgi:hypothetical protein
MKATSSVLATGRGILSSCVLVLVRIVVMRSLGIVAMRLGFRRFALFLARFHQGVVVAFGLLLLFLVDWLTGDVVLAAYRRELARRIALRGFSRVR